MTEGEIYRKSGENERIGSISGSPIEKTLPSDNPDALDYPASEDKDIEEAANSVTSAANQIYDGMHSIIRQLRPGALDNLGLSETLKDMISNYQTQNKEVNIDLNVGDLSLIHI